MLITRNTKQGQPIQKKQASFVKFSQGGFCLFALMLLLQLVPSFPFIQGGTQVWAQGFESPPQVIDDADGNGRLCFNASAYFVSGTVPISASRSNMSGVDFSWVSPSGLGEKCGVRSAVKH